MDDIIKLLQELMSKKPTPKGGIADTAAGVEFIGKKLGDFIEGDKKDKTKKINFFFEDFSLDVFFDFQDDFMKYFFNHAFLCVYRHQPDF